MPETYVHRIGRTGRAGNKGTSFSFCDQEEKAYLNDIQKLINKQVPVVEDHPFAMDPSMPIPKANTPKKAEQHKAQFTEKSDNKKKKKRFFRPKKSAPKS